MSSKSDTFTKRHNRSDYCGRYNNTNTNKIYLHAKIE
nr:MAG TPA: hypothetical protein [Caudoviricetes sp.]